VWCKSKFNLNCGPDLAVGNVAGCPTSSVMDLKGDLPEEGDKTGKK